MRVRTGRFRRIGKDFITMAESPFKAGYNTPRHVRFTRNTQQCIRARSAARSLRKVRAFTLSRPLRRAFGYYALC